MKEIIVNVDNYNENSIKTIEGDNLSEVYKIYICKNKRRVNLTNKIAVMAYVDEYNSKRSNILNLNITNAAEGEIELPITNIISEHNGVYACQVAIYGENNFLEQTAPFSLIVENNIFSKISNTAINHSDFHILSEAIKTTNAYGEKLKQGTENIELQYAYKLNEKMNKDDVLSMANMGQDVKEAMTGGSVAVVGENCISPINIIDKGVTYSKLYSTEFIRKINLNDCNREVIPTSLYVMPEKLSLGLLSVRYKTSRNGNVKFCIFTKLNEKICNIKTIGEYNSKEGINELCNIYNVVEDNQYLGIIGDSVLYDPSKGTGFYEVSNFNDDGEYSFINNLNVKMNIALDIMYGDKSFSEHMIKLTEKMLDDSSKHFNDAIEKVYEGISVNEFDFTEFTFKGTNNLYVPNKTFAKGLFSLVLPQTVGSIKLVVFEKESELFIVKNIQDCVVNNGLVNINYEFKGNGREFLGISVNDGIMYSKKDGFGFFEMPNSKFNSLYVNNKVALQSDNSIESGAGYHYKFPYYVIERVKALNLLDNEVYELINLVKNNTNNIDSTKEGLNEVINEVDTLKKETNNYKQLNINLSNLGLKYTEISDSVGFIGRWFNKEIDGVRCKCTINAGSEFYFKIKGTNSINIIFKNNHERETPYFAYSLDGKPFVRQLITNPTINNLSLDEHIIRVIIDGLTESENKWIGEKGIAFEKVDVGTGTIKGIVPRNRKIMFFGDSITEGVRVLNMNANANGNSSSGAFPFVTSAKLNSVSYRVGFGGSGVTKGGSGGIPKCSEVIDNITSQREASYVEPDLIVLNHGTNDLGSSSELFKEEYNKVLDRLTIKYSGVPIFVMIPFKQTHSSDIKECVKDRGNCYLVETNGWGVTYTDGTHPNIEGGVIAGEKLSNKILNVLGKSYFI
ncbi:GDSL-type esterase/lipase family protein [Clostridium perfringens]|nr:GDSL-type esterase/lipase family protein [Clostridium perfringens]